MGNIRSLNSYVSLRDKHIGDNMFVIGAGPSLWFNMYEPYFNYIHEIGFTIIVNSAVLADPNFDYWISNDSLCLRWSWWPMVKSANGTKIIRNSWYKYKDELKDFLWFSPRPTPEEQINPNDIGLAYCSSIPSAIDLSIQMGCKNVFILGLDHNEFNGRHHFWEFFKSEDKPKSIPSAQGSWESQKKVFPINIRSFNALNNFAKQKNVNIYNISWKYYGEWFSKVDVFEKIEIHELREIIK